MKTPWKDSPREASVLPEHGSPGSVPEGSLLPGLLCIIDRSSRLVSLNQVWETVLGRSLGNLRGSCLLDLVHLEDREETLEKIRGPSVAAETISLENRLRRSDGEYRWLRWAGMWHEGLLYAAAEDVSPLRREVDRSLPSLAALVEWTDNGIFGKDLEGVITSWNRGAERLYGYSAGEIIGRSVSTLIPPDRAHEVSEILAKIKRGETVEDFETERVRKDGRRVPIGLLVSPLRDAESEIVGACVIARDITRRKGAEKDRDELSAQVERQRGHLEGLVAAVPGVVFELRGRPGARPNSITFVSEHVETMLGYSGRDCLEISDFWHSIVHEEDREQTMAEAATIFDSGTCGDAEFRCIARDGKVVWVAARMTTVTDAAGRPVGIRGVAIDVTQRKKTEFALRESEEQLRQSQKMESLGRLAAGISHDFNNLLTVINNTAELGENSLSKGDPLRAEFAMIRDAGLRAASLTQQILAYGRKQVFLPEVINLNEATEQIVPMLQRLIGDRVRVAFLPAPDLLSVKADPAQVAQIIVNLAVNARDAMPHGGRLTIETQNVELDESYVGEHVAARPGPHVLLAVSDTGSGMDEATRQRIFEPFFSSKGPGKGSGLGLATVYGIVKQSGGSIWVYSELGKGTVVKVYLPAVDGKPPLPRAACPATTDSNETILVVEDEPGLRELAKRILESAGFEVLVAENGPQALDLLERGFEPHLLLADVVMPGMRGPELAERVRQIRPAVKILYTSGYADEAIVHHGFLDEGLHFIQKPYSISELTEKLREVLAS